MRVFGVGAYITKDDEGKRIDVCDTFIKNEIIGTGWLEKEAVDIHNFFGSLKTGDIVFMKSYAFKTKTLFIKAIGKVKDDIPCRDLELKEHELTIYGVRNVQWLQNELQPIEIQNGKNNVRQNTIYEEYHPDVVRLIEERVRTKRTNIFLPKEAYAPNTSW